MTLWKYVTLGLITACVLQIIVFLAGVVTRRKELHVLEILALYGERYGLEIVKQSEGRLSRGSIYVLLGAMEEAGLITSRGEVIAPTYIGITRRMYSIATRGRARLEASKEGRAWRS